MNSIRPLLFAAPLILASAAPAELTLPSIIGDHMVLQQKQANPVCNVHARNGLPMTPFRTDDFQMVTEPKEAPPSGPAQAE